MKISKNYKNNNIISKILSNQNAVIGGLLFAKQAFELIDSKIKFIVKIKDGSEVKKGSLIAIVKGKAKNILIAERVATLSAINIFFALPFTIAIKEPFLTSEPSFILTINLILLSINSNACFANNNPPITAFWFDKILEIILLFL